jgi:putative intracellular protease/amidase/rubredoxin
MKPIITLLAVLVLLGFGINSSNALDGYGYDAGYTCWMCPTCGMVYQLTPEEVASTSAFDYCQACGTYAAYFVQVQCTDTGLNEDSDNGIPYGYTESDGTGSEDSGTYEGSVDEGSVISLPDGQDQAETAPVVSGKILLVLPPSEYQETEFDVTRDHFQSKGFEVEIASKGVAVAKGMDGGQVEVDINLTDVDVSLYLAVVFIGGMGVDKLALYEDQDFIDLAKRAQAQDMVIAAICFAPQILANADLLQGKNATVSGNPVYYPSPINRLKDKGAIYQNELVVRDGKIITGNGIDASQAFAEMVVTVINEVGQTAEIEISDETSEEGTIEEMTEVETSLAGDQDRYICEVCGYVYDPGDGDPDSGIDSGTTFEDLPADWKCPLCGAGKDKFQPEG